jgi:hypothetical protein
VSAPIARRPSSDGEERRPRPATSPSATPASRGAAPGQATNRVSTVGQSAAVAAIPVASARCGSRDAERSRRFGTAPARRPLCRGRSRGGPGWILFRVRPMDRLGAPLPGLARLIPVTPKQASTRFDRRLDATHPAQPRSTGSRTRPVRNRKPKALHRLAQRLQWLRVFRDGSDGGG